MVTNLSGFPSALTVIPVPEGDVKRHKDFFIVNEDLKRLGCSGRAGLNVSAPTAATLAKFNQLYHTSDRIPFYAAVIELVKLSQVALVMFDKLAPEYADGLLCDVTERAINDWWTDVGTDYFNIEPSDGILGPTTVAGLLGLLMGARNRLNAYGDKVAKDVFDLGCTKRALAHFQKSQKLSKTRRLDRQTLDRLHKVTAKAANSEGWAVPRAVKSTVAELSGKGGGMVMGMVGAREKVGVAEVETLDIETFIQLVSGERAKWLWFGKPRKNNEGDVFSNLTTDDDMIFTGNERGGYMWSSRKRDSVVADTPTSQGPSGNTQTYTFHGSQTDLDVIEKEQAVGKTVFRNMTGRMNDAKSGLGRIKDAVGIAGLRGHHHKYSKEDVSGLHTGILTSQLPTGDKSIEGWDYSKFENFPSGPWSKTSEEAVEQALSKEYPTPALKTDESAKDISKSENLGHPQSESVSTTGSTDEDSEPYRSNGEHPTRPQPANASGHEPIPMLKDFSNVAGCEYRNHDRKAAIQSLLREQPAQLLRKSHSFSHKSRPPLKPYHQSRCPRHLSFSVVDDVLATADDFWSPVDNGHLSMNPKTALDMESQLTLRTELIADQLLQLRQRDGPWVEQRVDDIENLDTLAGDRQADLETMYHQRVEDYHSLRGATLELMTEERASLADAFKDLEVLSAKLEYEMNALHSKVEDVEDAVADFERQVQDLEGRANELEDEESTKESWLQSIARHLMGGTKSVD